jgi:hypothetical protein
VFQSGQTSPIRIYKRARPKDAPHPIHDPEDEYRAHQNQRAQAEAGRVSEGSEGSEASEGVKGPNHDRER